MWLDQDLLQVSEAQRRGGVLPTAVDATSRLPISVTPNRHLPFRSSEMVSAAATATATATAAKKVTSPTPASQLLGRDIAGKNMVGQTAGSQPNFALSALNAKSDRSAQAHGYAKGFAAGWAAGQRRAQREAQAEMERLQEQAHQAEEERADAFQAAMEQVANLAQAVQSRDELVASEVTETLAQAAVELAQALLGRELSDGPTRARATLDRALSVHEPKELVSVHMNPIDIDILTSQGVESPVELVADAELEPGDAIAHLSEGFLDARLTSALRRAKDALSACEETGGEL